MKTYYSEQLEHQANKKLIYYLESFNPEKVLLIFDHGLGDCVEFLSIFETLVKDYPKWDFTIGSHPSLNLSCLHDKWIDIKNLNKNYITPMYQSVVQSNKVGVRYDLEKLHKTYKFIFSIQFTDPRHPNANPNSIINISKIDKCKVMEIGYNDNKKLEKYIPSFQKYLDNSDSKNVIVHVGGSTDKSIKNPTLQDFEKIWNEIKQAGYNPFDVHMNNVSTILDTNIPLPHFIKPEETIRNSNGNLNTLINSLLKSKYIVGVLSGPLHLCNVLYRPENCLGLEGNFKISNYINDKIDTTNIYPYKDGSVYEWLKNKG